MRLPAYMAILLLCGACLGAAADAMDEGLGGSLRVGLPASSALRLTAPARGGILLQGFGAEGVPITEETPLVGPVTFSVSQGKVLCQRPGQRQTADRWLVTAPEGSGCQMGDRLLPGMVQVQASAGRLRAINILDVESYLVGVLRVEGSPTLHPETLKALAVAARTYAEHSRARHEAEGFDLCGTTHCQGYRGVDPAALWARQAVEATQGLVLVYGGQPIAAVYSTDCGGATANNEDVGIGRAPLAYLRGVRDAGDPEAPDFCRAGKYHRWSLTVPREELERKLNASEKTRIGRLVEARLEAPDRFGRPTLCRVTGLLPIPKPPPNKKVPQKEPPASPPQPAKGSGPAAPTANLVLQVPEKPTSQVIPVARLRQMLGEGRLRSTFVELSIQPNGDLEFHGRGYGHGAGLCATGANGMAAAPYRRSFAEILRHYYGAATLVDLGEWLEARETSPSSAAERPG